MQGLVVESILYLYLSVNREGSKYFARKKIPSQIIYALLGTELRHRMLRAKQS